MAVKSKMPPHWGSVRPMGHLGSFRKDMLGFFREGQNRFGDIYTARLGPRYVCVVSCAEAARTILVDNEKHFDKKTEGYAALTDFLGNGLLISEGDFWKRQRRIAQPAFHKQRIAELSQRMTTSAEQMCEDWKHLADDKQTIDVANAMMELTLQIAGDTLFSVDLTGDAARVGKAIDSAMLWFRKNFIGGVPKWWPSKVNRDGKRAIGILDELVYRLIRERRNTSETTTDLLSMFMEARYEDTGAPMEDSLLRDELVTMLSAGHETTANALAFTLYLLAKHPEIAAQARKEIERVIPKDQSPAMEHVASLEYLKQIFYESMRLYPPAWILARRPLQSFQLGEYQLTKKWILLIPMFLIHRNTSYWQSPWEFSPERFSKTSQDLSKKDGVPRNAFMPFSIGPRKCIGAVFAEVEALLVLATILRTFELSLPAGYDLEIEPSVTLRPKNAVPISLKHV